MIRRILFILIVSFWLFTFTTYGVGFTVSGKLQDQKNNPIPQGVIVISDKSGKVVIAATADSTGQYKVSIPQGIYSFSATGPKGIGLESKSLTNQQITSSRVLNFTLSAPISKVAQKSTWMQKFRSVIIGLEIDVALILIIGGYFFWKKKIRKSTSVESA